jgi:hypothetical protein
MSKIEIGILVLAALGLIGLIYLLAVGQNTDVLLPIVTALVAWLLGKKNPEIAGFIGGKK